jgi:hypothetical protein
MPSASHKIVFVIRPETGKNYCDMHRLIILIALVLLSVWIVCGAERTENMPNEHTPLKLVEAWLRFHESELCQSVDASFLFHDRRMEILYISKDEGMNQKMRELFQSPNGSYQVELLPTLKLKVKKSDADDEGPPPSLFMNNELLDYLRERPDLDILPYDSDRLKTDTEYGKWALKARLTAYAERILEWNRKVKQYAMDLPLLIRVALDPSAASETRLLAVTICTAHAQNLEKSLIKLETDLRQALPKVDKKERSSKTEKTGKAEKTLMESAEQISEAAQTVVQHIHQFLYPEQHSVTLDELRRPSLLDNLRALEKMVMDFQKALLSVHVAGKSK